MAEKYDDVLLPFMSLMRKELHANSRKGDRPGWLTMDANTALLEIYWHVAKLSAAVKNKDLALIEEHSADVANMAMMVLDVCGGIDADGEGPAAHLSGEAWSAITKRCFDCDAACADVSPDRCTCCPNRKPAAGVQAGSPAADPQRNGDTK